MRYFFIGQFPRSVQDAPPTDRPSGAEDCVMSPFYRHSAPLEREAVPFPRFVVLTPPPRPLVLTGQAVADRYRPGVSDGAVAASGSVPLSSASIDLADPPVHRPGVPTRR